MKETEIIKKYAIIGFITLTVIITSCNNTLNPCDCVVAYNLNDQSKVEKCEKHFDSLNDSEQEIWLEQIWKCEGDEHQEAPNGTATLPPEVQEKIDRINELNEKLQLIPDEYFGDNSLPLAKQKIALLKSMLELAEEIERSGYANQIENFATVHSGLKLQYNGVKMQIEGYEEMKSNNAENDSQEQLALEIEEFSNAFDKMYNDFSEAYYDKALRFSDYDKAKVIARNYHYALTSLDQQIKAYYDKWSTLLNREQKEELESIHRRVDLGIQQSYIDGGFGDF